LRHKLTKLEVSLYPKLINAEKINTTVTVVEKVKETTATSKEKLGRTICVSLQKS